VQGGKIAFRSCHGSILYNTSILDNKTPPPHVVLFLNRTSMHLIQNPLLVPIQFIQTLALVVKLTNCSRKNWRREQSVFCFVSCDFSGTG